MSLIKSINPFSNEVLESYKVHTDDQVKSALDLADATYQVWKQKKLNERSSLIVELGECIRAQADELAELITLEMGKPLAQAKAEIDKCADLCDFYAERAGSYLETKVVSHSSPEKLISYRPLGCVLAVMPWNFPFWQVIRFAVPTLLSGNVALLKHASNVSGCALRLERLFLEAGFEKGVFQTLVLPSQKVEALIESPIVKAVSLTGSGPAGSAVAETAGRKIKKVVLELGGSDPYLILKDADLDLAAEACVQSRLQNNGQSCIAAKRFIVHESVFDEFKNKVINICETKKYGDPMGLATDVGPLAKETLADELRDQVLRSKKAGAVVTYQKDCMQNSKAFFPITILENISKKCPAYSEEFFGPVFLLFKFSTLDEALELANDSVFGLGGGVFTSNVKLGREIAETMLDAGNVAVNAFVKSDPEMPFGGVKESGIGRELSSHGIYEFVNVKAVTVY